MNTVCRSGAWPLMLAVAAIPSLALAQDSDEDGPSLLEMEEVVVTGVAQGVTKLDTSVSVSSFNTEEIGKFSSRSIGEFYRSIPGIRSEPATGEGNGSISVRGIPLATGGYKYVQLQEDGLPVLQYGDIIAGNSPNYIRGDFTLERIEAIRGGSASTLTSSAPGAIINHISKTGTYEGGSAALTYGVDDFDEFRLDFDYGGPINDTLRFHIGGYFRQGEGPRDMGYNANDGGQIKANITKEFENGYARLYFKKLDESIATYFPQAVKVDGGGGFSAAPGLDGSADSMSSRNRTSIDTYDVRGNRIIRDITDQLEADVQAVGLELSFDVGEGWLVENRFRTSDVSGGLVGPLLAGAGDFGFAADVAANICGCTNPIVTFANGPNARPA